MTTVELTEQEIAQKIAAVRAAVAERQHVEAEAAAEQTHSRYRYLRDLTDAADTLLEVISNSEGRMMLGLPQIDLLTRGFGAKELIVITGFSHAGKTQLVNTMILHNRDKRILFFSLDDPAEMILTKLACMKAGISAETLEERIASGDPEARDLVYRAATQWFRNLKVVDESIGLDEMLLAVDEATDYWGAEPEAIIIDYLGLIPSASDGDGNSTIIAKSQMLKRWVKDMPCPVICLTQNSRGKGGPGEEITLLSMTHGGEQEATMVIGVRRKRDNEDLDAREREQHKHTVTLHVAKNKRPPSKTTPHDGIDFYMDPSTGLIRPLRDEDFGPRRPSGPITSAREAVQQHGARRLAAPYRDEELLGS